MGRKLPWQGGGSGGGGGGGGGGATEPAAKRQRLTTAPASAADKVDSSSGRARSPSTSPAAAPASSPPPTPPPATGPLEPMRAADGGGGGGGDDDGDDGWMMVEDEFEALARSFTRHLHHAEYARLVQAAKARPAGRGSSEMLAATTTTLSKQARRQMQRDALSRHQQASLARILQPPGNNDANDANDANEDDDNNPWRGTSLQGLMLGVPATQRPRPSLKGLERVPSATRAARGYSSSSRAVARPQQAEAEPRPDVHHRHGRDATAQHGDDGHHRHGRDATAQHGEDGVPVKEERSAVRPSRGPLVKQRQTAKQDRLATVPMFLV